MADFVSHGLISTGFVNAIPRRFARTKIVTGGICAALGMWPDIVPQVAAWFGADRWNGLYADYNLHWTWLDLLPPFGLHVAIDKLFHAPEGGWTTLGWCLEFPVLLLGISMFLWTFPSVLQWIILKLGGHGS